MVDVDAPDLDVAPITFESSVVAQLQRHFCRQPGLCYRAVPPLPRGVHCRQYDAKVLVNVILDLLIGSLI